MKRPTLSEVLEVRALAVTKLAGLDAAMTSLEYERALFDVMQSVAADLGMRIFDSVFLVNSPETLETFDRYAPSAMVVHLVVLHPLESLRPWLEKLGAEGRIRSVIVLNNEEQAPIASTLASEIDDFPVFLVRDSEEAMTVVNGLDTSRLSVLQDALNYDRVAIRDLSGNPS